MIERYTRQAMGEHWSQTNKYATWLKVELAALQALAAAGILQQAEVDIICQKARFDTARIDAIEKEVKHDVIAFVTNVAENVGPLGRHIHYGLTSSDVVDTGFALQLKEGLEMILAGVAGLKIALKKRALEHKDTLQMGRSHGIHAEPITFGLKLALYYEEMARNERRLRQACDNIAFGKLSGAVGTYAHLSADIEKKTCALLGLKPEIIATQVIQRDRHAEVFTALAILGGTVEKIAVELRHLQRTEVREAEEFFSPGQKGSSAMPHKRNPISAENLTGGARLLRSYAVAALENMALWHERDISHSSVERVIGPDAFILADYMVHRLTGIIEKLIVYPDRMLENLHLTCGLIFSQGLLLRLVERGVDRDTAYRMTQRNAMRVWDEGGNFKDFVMNDKDLTQHLKENDLKEVFSLDHYVKSRDEIFSRIF